MAYRWFGLDMLHVTLDSEIEVKSWIVQLRICGVICRVAADQSLNRCYRCMEVPLLIFLW